MRSFLIALTIGAGTAQTSTPINSRYTLVGQAGCRGNGGAQDQVNHKSALGLTQAQCETECDTIGDSNANLACVGYMFFNLGAQSAWECAIYGPGVDGSCPDGNARSNITCGTCSLTSGANANRISCVNNGGTWTPGGWTAPPNSQGVTWTGSSYPTTHVHTAATTSAG
jgi:hypothetical protein